MKAINHMRVPRRAHLPAWVLLLAVIATIAAAALSAPATRPVSVRDGSLLVDRPVAPALRAPLPPHKGPLWLCPVDPPRHYYDDFGAPRYGGGFHYHQGIDIFASRGTPIRAPFDGRAEASTNWAGGLAVRVFGPKGFVYNAHLTALGHLGKVRAGTVIGYVGNSGDAIGASTHDHFEWHPGGGAAVDAYPYLLDACRSHPLPTPDTTSAGDWVVE
jgi:murein DD-endopeptidase MepM/ murein hydrolase activator NlpD